MNKNLIVLLVAFFFFSCRDEKADLILQAEKSVTSKTLESQDFKRVFGVDVILFEKVKGDTSIFYQFNSLADFPILVFWEFPLESFDSIQIDNILSKYDCMAISNVSCGDQFLVHSFHNNTLMKGLKLEEENKRSLIVSYSFPQKFPAGTVGK